MPRTLKECLQDTHFLKSLDHEKLDELVSVMKKQRFSTGDTVFKQGDKGDLFYLVSSGTLAYETTTGFETKKAASLRHGDYFGEGALISNAPRAATVVAETDCELYYLDKTDFQKTLMGNPDIAAEINKHMATRKMSRA